MRYTPKRSKKSRTYLHVARMIAIAVLVVMLFIFVGIPENNSEAELPVYTPVPTNPVELPKETPTVTPTPVPTPTPTPEPTPEPTPTITFLAMKEYVIPLSVFILHLYKFLGLPVFPFLLNENALFQKFTGNVIHTTA